MDPVASPKTHPPAARRTPLQPRPALEARLRAALPAHRVVLVCAPAGYGKTALLARALVPPPAGEALAWVSLDPGDDLGRLLGTLLEALEPLDLPWRIAPEGVLANALRGDVRSRQQAVDALVQALDGADTTHGTIVLDDLHHVDDPAAEHFLARLIERLGPRWTLVLASRAEPAALVARVAAAGELATFREPDLQFSVAEVEAWFGASGLPADSARQWHARTAGWAAGLRLAASGAGTGSPGALIDRSAFDFFTTEVLAHVGPPLRSFLLETSVLQELDAPRCAALTGDAQAAQRLDEIERRGLFASVVDAQGTLRLHDLFRDALRHRLRIERPEAWPALLRRAAALEQDPVRRQALLHAAPDLPAAARALLEDAPRLNTGHGVETVLRLLERFDAAFVAANAELQHVAGIAKVSIWRNGEAERHFARARELYDAQGASASAQTMRARRAAVLVPLGRLAEAAAELDALRGASLTEIDGQLMATTAAMWLRLERAEYAAVAPLYVQLVERMASCTGVPEWSTVPPPRQIACRGMAAPLRRWAAGALALAGDRPLPLRHMATIALGWLALWQGRFDEAAELLASAESDASWSGQEVITRNHGSGLHAMLALVRGAHDVALGFARERIASLPAGYGDWGRWHGLVFSARIAAGCGDAAALRAWLDELQALAPQLAEVSAARLRPVAGLAGTLALLDGDRARAQAHWDEVLAHEEEADLLAQSGEVRARLAALRLRDGDRAAAAALLRPLLDAADDGPRGLVYVGATVAELAQARWDDALDAAQRATLQRWADALQAARRAAPPPAPAPAPSAAAAATASGERLSARELDVVALIARGASNKLIARELDLSPHTVKRHVANTLGKLGLASRGEIAAWHHRNAQRSSPPSPPKGGEGRG